uniref:Pericentrin/AKAP-450 centrosomal targeting domain-containing protein n=1 Tax=Anopheles epiroticus TaxID=199890 RepID=A0A182PBV6_9DIPT
MDMDYSSVDRQGPAAKKAFAGGVTSTGSSTVSVGSASVSKSTSSYGSSRKESSVRFRLEDELVGSGSDLSESGSASISESLSANDNHDDDSLEIMEEILVPADADNDDDDEQAGNGATEISSASGPSYDGHSDDSSARSAEVISLHRSKQGNVASGGGGTVADRKRQLFDIGEDEDFLPRSDTERPPSGGGSLFDIDRLNLSGDDIAQHFQTTVESDRSEKEESPFGDRPRSSENEEYEDSFGQAVSGGEDVKSSVGEPVASRQGGSIKSVEEVKVHHAKELSPLNEDDVLINDSKVNLNALKQRNQIVITQRVGIKSEDKNRKQNRTNVNVMAEESNNNSQDNSLNTTNDISDLAPDTESERVGSVELDASSGSMRKVKLSADGRSRSMPDGIGGAAKSGDAGPSGAGFTSLGAMKMSEMISGQPKEESCSSSTGGSGISEDLRERILTTSKSFEEVKAQGVAVIEALEDKTERPAGEATKSMERVSADQKEALEDISEESEHTIGGGGGGGGNSSNTDDEQLRVVAGTRGTTVSGNLIERGKEMRTILEEKLLLQKQLSVGSTIYEDNKENIPEGGSLKATPEFDSVISLKMFQTMENEIRKLNEIIATKDVLLTAYGRKDSAVTGKETSSCNSRAESLREQQPCRSHNSDSISMATNSTEYRPVGELAGELAGATSAEKDLYGKIMERNQWIELLADKLKESLQERNQLQSEGDKLAAEVIQLKKQLAETVENMKLKAQQSSWAGVTRPQDQESTSGGQRISEISIDLVSETEDGGLSDFPDIYDDPPLGTTERLLDPHTLQPLVGGDLSELNPMHIPLKISKQLEQFRRYLSPEEVRLFNMVQGKFDDFLTQELDKVRDAGESENRLLREQLQIEHAEKEQEVNRLRQMLSSVKAGSIEITTLRTELEARHTQEMADLRTYFEKKVVELEKQYSEEVFSQQSRRLSNDDTASEISGAEEFPEENGGYQSKHTSPRRKHKEDIYLSPTHRKITPTTIDATDASADEVLVVEIVEEQEHRHLTAEEVREFYQSKIKELNAQHERVFSNLRRKLKAYEAKEQEKHVLIVQEQSAPQPQGSSIRLHTPTLVGELGSDCDLQEIIDGYERRLQEQVALARQDVLRELEIQIQALLSDSSFEDSHWPPELVLLREKFTAKSQLEIAQLQLKHEEEMARMRNDFEKQLQRKLKRHTTFDSSRGLDKIISERDNLRELSSTLRNVVGGLAKYFSICEEDLNSTVLEELHRYQQLQQHANESHLTVADVSGVDDGQLAVDPVADCSASESALNVTDASFLASCKLLKFAPDVSGIISIIEDPSLVDYVSAKAHQQQRDGDEEAENISLNLEECVERLKAEALSLLALSERIKQRSSNAPKEDESDKVSEKNDSCEEEDGLKRRGGRVLESTRSFDENIGREGASERIDGKSKADAHSCRSLPIDLTGLQLNGELNMQLHELKNRLLKSEDERKLLETELAEARSKQNSLVSELSETKQHLLELNSQRVEFSEGYGTNALLPTAQRVNNSFVELQERAKLLLGSSSSAGADQTIEDNSVLLQLVEDFCREGERYLEDGKRDRIDLQLQIEAADKQLKATRQFLEDQAAEREQERDEFVKEIERLKGAIREKEKDKVNFERASKELESMEQQVKELTTQIADRDDRLRKMEADLKDSIDKGFTLREIIAELETQMESKTINEHVLETKVKELEKYIDVQNQQNESLHQEMESVKTDLAGRGYDEKIAKLEEELRQRRPSAEQSIVLEALTVQLRDIEETLDRKTKNLETLHSTSGASLGCSSPSEDVSVNQDSPLHRQRRSAEVGVAEDGTPNDGDKSKVTPLPVDEVQRIFDKLHRHSRVEDVAIKRINDLEMQISNIRGGYAIVKVRSMSHPPVITQTYMVPLFY